MPLTDVTRSITGLFTVREAALGSSTVTLQVPYTLPIHSLPMRNWTVVPDSVHLRSLVVVLPSVALLGVPRLSVRVGLVPGSGSSVPVMVADVCPTAITRGLEETPL